MKIPIEGTDAHILMEENFLSENMEQVMRMYSDELFNVEGASLSYYKNKGNFIQNNPRSRSQMALWYGDVPYKYGKYHTLTPAKMPELIGKLARLVEEKLGYNVGFFNSVYVNRYENGGIGKHHDNDGIFKMNKSWDGGRDIVVAVVSFGGPSTITLYKSFRSTELAGEVVAENNSLYVMSENFQNRLYHKVGKSDGIRYSYTFRHTV